MPWITLSASAEVPRASVIRRTERQRLLQDILECERAVVAAETFVRRRQRSADDAIDPEEVRNGWRKFFLAHAAFFHTFALLADTYRHCAERLEQGGLPRREIDQAAALWRLAGALMLYGVDFSPTEEIYQRYVRPRMPEAFSGTWLREYQLLSNRRRAFDRALEASAAIHGELVRDLRASLADGERGYHNYHFQVMLACVPDLTSKLQEYQMEHGKLTRDERQCEIYDEWFHVLRLADIDLSSYVRSVCAVFSELLADVAAGTFLEREAFARLTAGVAVVLEILRGALYGARALGVAR